MDQMKYTVDNEGGSVMNFYSMRDLRTESKTVWDDLNDGDEVVLTNNGKPSAIMVSIPEGKFDETVQAVRQAKAMIAFASMRKRAAKAGFMSDDEINSIIQEVRNGENTPSGKSSKGNAE